MASAETCASPDRQVVRLVSLVYPSTYTPCSELLSPSLETSTGGSRSHWHSYLHHHSLIDTAVDIGIAFGSPTAYPSVHGGKTRKTTDNSGTSEVRLTVSSILNAPKLQNSIWQ